MTYDNLPETSGWQIYRVGQGILVEGDALLLCGNRWYRGKPLAWTLPGGRAEDGEGVAEAAVREFREETGLQVVVRELAFVAEARSVVSRRLFLTCAFTVERVGGTLTQGLDPAVEEARFVPIADLPQLLAAPSLRDPLLWRLSHPQETARYWFFPEYAS